VINIKVLVGDKVYVPNESKPYRVRVRDERYIICTKPFNPKKTVLYFIIDLQNKRRSPDNMIFCHGYETDEQCQERLQELETEQIELSWRHGIDLDIEIE